MSHRIFVTGSRGFVGLQLGALLAERGCDVIGLDLPGRGSDVECDLSDPSLDVNALAEQVGPVSGLIHLAAHILRGSSVDARARSNLRAIADAPVRLTEAFQRHNREMRVVYCSSIKTYGRQVKLPAAPEASPLRPDAFCYGSAKALGERLMQLSQRRNEGSLAIVRPGFIYGPGQPANNAIRAFLGACWQGQRPTVFGDGLQLRDDVLVSDVAACLAEAYFRRAQGIFNAASGQAVTLLHVAETCCRAVEAVGGPQGLTPLLDSTRPAAHWIDQTYDIARTRNHLGYRPTELVEGLVQEARWVKDGAVRENAPNYTRAKCIEGQS
jgi:nucleoside-diphosphate-sugar epimerase